MWIFTIKQKFLTINQTFHPLCFCIYDVTTSQVSAKCLSTCCRVIVPISGGFHVNFSSLNMNAGIIFVGHKYDKFESLIFAASRGPVVHLFLTLSNGLRIFWKAGPFRISIIDSIMDADIDSRLACGSQMTLSASRWSQASAWCKFDHLATSVRVRGGQSLWLHKYMTPGVCVQACCMTVLEYISPFFIRSENALLV